MFYYNQRHEIKTLERATGAKIELIYPPRNDVDIGELTAEMDTKITRTSTASTLVFEELAESLILRHGTKALTIALRELYGSKFSSRSLLASRADYTTILVKGPRIRSKAGVTEILENFLSEHGDEEVQHLGLFSLCSGGAVLDVPETLALRLMDAASESSVENYFKDTYALEIPTELPELIENHTANRRGHFGSRGSPARFQNNNNNNRGKSNDRAARYQNRHQGNRQGNWVGSHSRRQQDNWGDSQGRGMQDNWGKKRRGKQDNKLYQREFDW
jgi:hypothetical protein